MRAINILFIVFLIYVGLELICNMFSMTMNYKEHRKNTLKTNAYYVKKGNYKTFKKYMKNIRPFDNKRKKHFSTGYIYEKKDNKIDTEFLTFIFNNEAILFNIISLKLVLRYIEKNELTSNNLIINGKWE